MKPLETAEENVRRLSNNNFFVLHFPEHNETDKSLITKCEKCQIEYCNNECKMLASEAYHDILCLGDDRLNSEHPMNILYDSWKYLK